MTDIAILAPREDMEEADMSLGRELSHSVSINAATKAVMGKIVRQVPVHLALKKNEFLLVSLLSISHINWSFTQGLLHLLNSVSHEDFGIP